MRILVLIPLTDAQRSRLQAAVPDTDLTYTTAHDATDEQLAAAEVIVGNLPPARIAQARSLKLIQLNSAGYDDYATAELPGRAALCCAVGAYGQAVAEHTFAMVLALIKRLPAYHASQLTHTWEDHGPVTTLAGARVLVLGAGDIGSHFAHLAHAMGAHVTGMRRSAAAPHGDFSAMRTMDELLEELPASDVAVSFLPSAPSTRGLADARFFAAMPRGSFFANGGRGDLVVADALIDALASGQLAGAALDVTAPEPLPAQHPLWDAPNLLITPHVAGGFHLPAVLDNITDLAIENIRHLAAGEDLRNHVR